MQSLQNRIFIFIVILLLLVQAMALWTLISGKNNQEKLQINNHLISAKTIFKEVFNSRRDSLTAFSATAAQDYGIKQVFGDDKRSLLVALNNHRKRIKADLAMTISADFSISAQLLKTKDSKQQVKISQGPEGGQPFRYQSWLLNENIANLYMLDNALYQLSLSPLKVGSKVIGWLGFGFKIDQALAQRFLSLTQLDTDFLFNNGQQWLLIASSNNHPDSAFSLAIIEANIPSQYIALGHIIEQSGQQRLGVAMYGLRAKFIDVLQQQWLEFIILAFITLLLSLASAYWIAASITRPILRLVTQAKRVARGDYHQPVTLNDSSELGQLADEFNLMQQAVLSREQAISHRANHNPLTDLPNRDALANTLARLISSKKSLALYHLNLNRLKEVNETLGHDVGDRLILEVAQRLAALSGFEFLSHIGADEFVLTLITDSHINHDEAIARIDQQLAPSFEYQGIELSLQVTIGYALSPQHSADSQRLLQMADTALQYARKNNRSKQLYHHDLAVNSVERLNLINELKIAITDNQLELFYQPKLCLSSGKITHMEALVRWHHPKLGLVPPDDFIHIAEKTGQINALTAWVVKAALSQQACWQKQQITLNLAVNISAQNLRDANFYQFICEQLALSNVPANRLTLEVTESAVVEDPQSAIALLRKFKQQGIKLSIDDYGTGYSSLAQLKQLPVHELKIDKSFVLKLKDDEDDQIIVHSTIELAHNMGLSVVAEGIEDEYTMRWLAQHGCELGQGYFISRPQPADKITLWLQQQPRFNLTRITS